MSRNLLKVAALLPLLIAGMSARAIDIVDGVYQIGTPQDFTEFAELVNTGETSINAALTADIDMGGAEWGKPIGYWIEGPGGKSYAGIFDGKGHTICNLTINGAANNVNCGGLFGLGNASAIIRNLVVRDCSFSSMYSIGCIAGEWYGLMENCAAFDVQISGMAMYGLIGYGGSVKNSFTNYPVAYRDGATTATNCFAIGDLSEIECTCGKLCVLLNQGLESPVWFQNIGTDPYPVLDSSHAVVYATEIKCDGSITDNATFTNDASLGMQKPTHQFEGIFCENCGMMNKDYACAQEGDVYLISNWDDMYWFSYQVNTDNDAINGKLTADIDNFTYEMMMKRAYKGKFDGNGHSITLNFENPGDFSGIFRDVESEVCNLTVRGTMTLGGNYGGGITAYITGVVRNCSSYVTINSLNNGCHGGIAFMMKPTGRIENCFCAPTFIGNTLSQSAEMFGWADGGVIENCMVITEAEANAGVEATFYRGWSNLYNCYYKNAHGNTNGATQLTDEQLDGGEACWLLNKQNFTSPNWFQNLNEDDLPVLDPTHNIVLFTGTEYVSFSKENYAPYMNALAENALADAQSLSDNALANQSLIDEYTESINVFANAPEWGALDSCYQQMVEKRKVVQANIDAYENYSTTAKTLRETITAEMSGTFVEQFLSYLTDNLEPNEDFPNGSYEYIMEMKQLGTDGVNDEIEFMKTLHEKAMATTALPGSDLTLLLKNADFRAESLGWSGDMQVGYVPSLPVVECHQNTGELYQTFTGMKNGLYEFTLNAWSRAGGNDDSRMYSSYIFANDQVVPVMNVQEDPISEQDAVDLQNCYITDAGTYPYDKITNDNCYIPWSYLGAPYAFNGGRYLNRILVNVTDGTLKVGVRAMGTGNGGDCMEFNNAKLYYLGDFNDSNEGLTDVLAGQIARAKALVETQVSADDPYIQPNYSTALREKLASVVANAETAESAEDKYNAITALSPMFAEVLDGEKAYIHMMKEVENSIEALYDDYSLGDVSESLLESLNAAGEIFWDGSYSTEEAWNFVSPVGCKMAIEDNYYLITNAEDLAWFARLVYQNNSNINGKLTADIDMAGAVWSAPISFWKDAGWGRNYYGTFDGQGHTISNLTIDGASNGVCCGGLFGLGREGAVLKNLILRDCTFTALYSIGGMTGEWYGTAENCATINVQITGSNPHGVIGHGGSIKNSFSTYADVFNPGATTGTNCYGAGSLEEADYASGKLCYLLNGDQSVISWYQNIGEDAYPVLNPEHSVVIQNQVGGYENVTGIMQIANDKCGGNIYNLMGQKVQKAQNGIYIIGGKKTLYK